MEPRAIRSWTWVDDRTSDIGNDLRNFKLMRLTLGDTIWPLDYVDGPRPTPRIDGTTWQYGQNLTTAEHGWYPAEYATRLPENMLHDAQRQGTSRTYLKHSFTGQPLAALSALAKPAATNTGSRRTRGHHR